LSQIADSPTVDYKVWGVVKQRVCRNK